MKLIFQAERIKLYQNFLNPDECEGLIYEASSKLERALSIDDSTGKAIDHPDRKAWGTFLPRGESILVETIEARIEESFPHLDHSKSEELHVIKYDSGSDQYLPHYDWFDPRYPANAKRIEDGGQRVATLLLYLNTPESGGETSFPKLKFKFSPVAGFALLFEYPSCDLDTLHSGEIASGEKWVASRWFRG